MTKSGSKPWWLHVQVKGNETEDEEDLDVGGLVEAYMGETILPVKCDCGGERAKTTHAGWCSTRTPKKK